MPCQSLSRNGSSTSLISLYSSSSIELEPYGRPQLFQGAMVWNGEEMRPEHYIVTFSDKDVESVRTAVVHFKRKSPLSTSMVHRVTNVDS